MFVSRCILGLVCYDDEDWMVISIRFSQEKRHRYALEKGWNVQNRNMVAESEETGAGKFTNLTNNSPTRMLAQGINQEEENVELCLELSLNGRFGANPSKTRTPADNPALKMKVDEENDELNLGLSLNGKFGINPRTSKTSTLGEEEEWRKRRWLDKTPPHFSTQVSNASGMNKQDLSKSSSEEDYIDFGTFLMYIHEDLVDVANTFFASEAAKKK